MSSVRALLSLAILLAMDRSTVRSPTSTIRPPRMSALTLLVTLRVLPSPTKEDLEIEAERRLTVLLSRGEAEVMVASTTPLAALVKVSNFSTIEGMRESLLFSARRERKLETVLSALMALDKVETTVFLSSVDRAGFSRIAGSLASFLTSSFKATREDSVLDKTEDLEAAVYYENDSVSIKTIEN